MAFALLKQIRSIKIFDSEVPIKIQVMRMDNCITLLLDIAKEIFEESGDKKVKPLLIFDEVQELTRDSRSGRYGGRTIFSKLVTSTITNSNDGARTAVIMAASSSFLDVDIGKQTNYNDVSRWIQMELLDPDESAIRLHFKNEGFDEAQVNTLINTFGLRLRYLNQFNSPKDMEMEIERKLKQTSSMFKAMFQRMDITGHGKKMQ